ncbi:MAG: N-acetylmuramoyl-L-alanine amidase, partial [Deltaproteobacteria bacterium]|nr:N-acetylmuramoyl-L-alanine amidase [Deltaproteobacteria bacterium]
DPGHGGHDPGAVGYNGLYEKDVVLDIALKVRDIMHREHQNYEIILTRDADFFIPLHKRAEIANRANADMFISIHTNASYNRMAYGVETYILNWTDDEEAMRVAARENAISLKEMKRLRDELSIILASLESEIKRDESIKAAGFIHRSLVSEIPFEYPEFDRGVKQALFYVLVGAKMPSVLLEIGFISNPYEEKMLRNERFRLDIAKSIVSGILNYFSGLPINKTYVVHTTTNSNQKGKAIPLKYSKFKR